jgi:two-component system CheB/CheR fusion protein
MLIVAIGASAGGLKAMSSLLAEIPANTGMAFVVIQHLDPAYESQLTALLARTSPLPVQDAIDGVELLSNNVYVITPNTAIAIVGGILRITPRERGPAPHLTIDACLRSLAADRHGSAIGVILSGTGTDGTLGLAAIKAAGGVTFAQDDSAEHQGMPSSAIGGGHVDFVLTPGEIAKELGKIAHFGFPTLPSPAGDAPASAVPSGTESLSGGLTDFEVVLDRLRVVTRVDFTHYRLSTIARRIKRRMDMCVTPTVAEYVSFLDADPGEIEILARDILIHVTSFYRDQAAFESLKALVFPTLMSERSDRSPIRLWVIGCSTGQEVYSLAIELMDELQRAKTHTDVQIFATDISDWALSKARIGWYPDTISEEIPADRLARYFTRDAGGFRIAKAIRDRCVFAKHDITSDIPFSKMDLVTCRNVLIYFGPLLQERVFQSIHFALKTGGYLLLGNSETIGRRFSHFGSFDDENRIYRSLATNERFKAIYIPPPCSSDHSMLPPATPPIQPLADMQRAADQIVLGRFAPAGVLVTEAMDIIQFRGRTSPYLEPAPGEASLNLLTMVPFRVAEVLREAIDEVKRSNVPVRREHIAHRREQNFREIAAEVIPIKLPSTTATCYLVLFEEQSAALDGDLGAPTPTVASVKPADVGPGEVDQLHHELAAATDYVRTLVEQNRMLTEQVKSAQEESQSTNEEFRSTNEELQTAKEEVESTNEELITINDELRAANEDLGKVSAALRETAAFTAAIVETMRYPLLVLDGKLRVESANQAFINVFQVDHRKAVGCLIYELDHGQWDIPELHRLLEDILSHDTAFDDFTVTHDFRAIGRRTLLLNARRLASQGDHARQIVLVIADITEQAINTARLEDLSNELLRSNQDLDQFAAVASHDLQEPLRSISSYVSLLLLQYDSLFDERARKYMSYIVSGTARMNELIKGILTYSRIGHAVSEIADQDSSVIVKLAIANLKAKISEANADIVEQALPHVMANREQLMRLFQNLLSNALKFRSMDRKAIIRITAAETAQEWIFSIADNGIGIEEASHSKIFDIFQRLHDQSIPGTGIGLATCKKIIDHHRGRIWVDSIVGTGSTFYFSLPK